MGRMRHTVAFGEERGELCPNVTGGMTAEDSGNDRLVDVGVAKADRGVENNDVIPQI